jgi:hypothetical protein
MHYAGHTEDLLTDAISGSIWVGIESIQCSILYTATIIKEGCANEEGVRTADQCCAFHGCHCQVLNTSVILLESSNQQSHR